MRKANVMYTRVSWQRCHFKFEFADRSGSFSAVESCLHFVCISLFTHTPTDLVKEQRNPHTHTHTNSLTKLNRQFRLYILLHSLSGVGDQQKTSLNLYVGQSVNCCKLLSRLVSCLAPTG